jgi:DNA-binding CsgD family transcriptional regulator
MEVRGHVLKGHTTTAPIRGRVQAPAHAPSAALPANLRSNQRLSWGSVETPQSGAGFLLIDLNLKPIHTNQAAALILHYPNMPPETDNTAALQERLRSILQLEHMTPGSAPTTFFSGRRRYVCRSFLLESREDGLWSSIVALVLERRPRDPVELSEVRRRFHLSRREGETVQYLIHGLTTKEVAQRMSVSPNTIKQFVRLIMSKMGVTTRSGIIGKLIGG